MNIQLICSLAVSLWTMGQEAAYAPRTDAMRVDCENVAIEADRSGMDPFVAVALSWEESRFTENAKSTEGAIGAMQVIPRYSPCLKDKEDPCTIIKAGVIAYLKWLETYETPRLALCHYNNGNTCHGSGRRYANRVLKKSEELRIIAEKCDYACGC